MSSFTMYTTSWCGFCRRLKSQLAQEGITYTEIDIDEHPESAGIVEAANKGNRTVPTLVYSDGDTQTNPSVKQVQKKIAALA